MPNPRFGRQAGKAVGKNQQVQMPIKNRPDDSWAKKGAEEIVRTENREDKASRQGS